MTSVPTLPAALTVPASQPALELAARRYAAMARIDAEALIDEQVAAAIRAWRVADATIWQRIKFRSRMIRTASAHRGSTGEKA